MQLENYNVAAVDCLRGGKLAVLSLKLPNRRDITAAAFSALTGKLEEAESIDAFCARIVRIRTRRRRLKVALDGEIVILNPPLEVTLRVGALQVFAPLRRPASGMYRIVHISDSHFGRIQAGLPERLISAVHELRPHAVVTTGDVTQRARRNQFRAARGFLTSLPKPLIVAPGNHDVPLFNVAARFLWKLRGFNKYLRPISAPYIAHEQALIVPVDTTMSFTIHRGRVSKAALAKARVAFGTARSSMLKIALLHHPVVVPDDVGSHMRLQDADETLREFAGIGVDLILSGHTHRPFVQIVSAQGTQGERQILAITAGTAVSSRIKRDYGNSFYLLEVLTDALHLTEYRYAPQSQRFSCVSHATFVRPLPGSWSLASLRHAADEGSFKPNSN